MKKVAVIEDNADNRLLVQAILKDEYELVEYENGVEALENLHKDEPDLILLDISLPEIDGLETLVRIRQSPRFQNTPVLALTAHAMSGDREKYLEAGFDDYISKPILDESILTKAVAQWLTAKPSY